MSFGIVKSAERFTKPGEMDSISVSPRAIAEVSSSQQGRCWWEPGEVHNDILRVDPGGVIEYSMVMGSPFGNGLVGLDPRQGNRSGPRGPAGLARGQTCPPQPATSIAASPNKRVPGSTSFFFLSRQNRWRRTVCSHCSESASQQLRAAGCLGR